MGKLGFVFLDMEHRVLSHASAGAVTGRGAQKGTEAW